MTRGLAHAAIVSIALGLAGCGGLKMQISPENQTLRTDDEFLLYEPCAGEKAVGPEARIDVEGLKGAKLNTEFMSVTVPVKVINGRDKTVMIQLNRSEIEQTDGGRRKRYKATGMIGGSFATAMGAEDNVLVPPGGQKGFTVVFGSKDSPLKGDSFRVYLCAVQTDGSGGVDNVPYLVLGNGTFAKDPKPIQHEKRPVPPADAGSSGAAKKKTCASCGSFMPETATACPTCGAR